MSTLKDKVVIVTGGSSGIGRAAAKHFAEAGAKVIVTGRRAAALEEIARDHAGISVLVADAAAPQDAARTVAEAVEAHGRLDVLVNNAGAGALLPLAEATAERIEGIFSVNVVGASLLATAALPHLVQSNGAIVNVSSIYGHKPAAGLSHYAASKAALEHLTRCWALELAPRGVRVNAVAPGPTASARVRGREQVKARGGAGSGGVAAPSRRREPVPRAPPSRRDRPSSTRLGATAYPAAARRPPAAVLKLGSGSGPIPTHRRRFGAKIVPSDASGSDPTASSLRHRDPGCSRLIPGDSR